MEQNLQFPALQVFAMFLEIAAMFKNKLSFCSLDFFFLFVMFSGFQFEFAFHL